MLSATTAGSRCSRHCAANCRLRRRLVASTTTSIASGITPSTAPSRQSRQTRASGMSRVSEYEPGRSTSSSCARPSGERCVPMRPSTVEPGKLAVRARTPQRRLKSVVLPVFGLPRTAMRGIGCRAPRSPPRSMPRPVPWVLTPSRPACLRSGSPGSSSPPRRRCRGGCCRSGRCTACRSGRRGPRTRGACPSRGAGSGRLREGP